MINLNVKIEGLRELKSDIDKFTREVGSLDSPLKEAGKYMEEQAVMNFSRKGSLMQTGGWSPLKQSTKDYKAKSFPNKGMMIRTSNLKNSFDSSRTGAGKLKVFNPLDYASYHQEGTINLPMRILLKFEKQQVSDITKIMHNWVEKTLNKNFTKTFI